MILLIDNYDSFVYNLAHYLEMSGQEVKVIRNDQFTVEEIKAIKPEAIVISPGPGAPLDAGICIELIREAAGLIPILGVCLGHQAIGEAFGATIIRSNKPQHGSSSEIYHQGKNLFQGLPNPIEAGRYHSLIIDDKSLPVDLFVTARTKEGVIMGVEHRSYPVYGVQFHPESILTPQGHEIIHNFLSCCRKFKETCES